MNLFHRKTPFEVALPELDAALQALSSVRPPAGLAERMQLAIERAAEELPAKPAGRFGLLAFAGRTPMRLAASVAVGIAVVGGAATYEWQGAHRSVPIVAPIRMGGGFGAAGAARTPILGAPVQSAATPAGNTHKAPTPAGHGNLQPHHTLNSRAHVPKHPVMVQPAPQP
jgi:hypothetical protein